MWKSRHDKLFYYSLLPLASTIVLVVIILALILIHYSLPSLERYGVRILVEHRWLPREDKPGSSVYGLLIPLTGTLVTSITSIVLSLPLVLSLVILVEEILPTKISSIFSSIVDVMAAIPTVVYGLWGLETLSPLLRNYIYTTLYRKLGFIELFSCKPYVGTTYLTASILLAIIVTPYMFVIIREAYRAIPSTYKEAIYALGATRYEAVKTLVSMIRPAIVAGMLLAFGRAAGETVATALVIGSSFNPPNCLLSPGYTISSLIANQFGESFLYPYMASVLYLGGLVLLGIGVLSNILGLYYLRMVKYYV